MSLTFRTSTKKINKGAYEGIKRNGGFSGSSSSSASSGNSGASRAATPTPVINNNVGVRGYLKSAGLDESKIGWSDGKVTYGGRSFTPTENRDGVTYADKKSLDNFISGIHADAGNVGVRKTFSDLGLDTGKLGWSGGRVTYGGIGYVPPINSNGVTYGAKQDVMDFAAKALRGQGDDLIRVNRYRGPNGLYDVAWNGANKKVLIGGREVPYAYIDADGNAWAKESDLSAAYKRLAEERGIRSPEELYSLWQQRADSLDRDYRDLAESKFTFGIDDLENDPTWKAYAEMYQREADKAYLDTLANVSARTGGSMSTMAQIAADEARNRMLRAKTDIIPTIAQAAYERYADAINLKGDILDKRYSLYGDDLSYGSAMSDKARTLYENAQNAQRQRMLDSYSDRQTEAQLDAADDDYRFKRLKNAYDTADMFNVPINSEIAGMYGIAPDENGVYPTPNQIAIAKQQEIWDKYEKGIYDYQTASELEKYAEQQAIAMEVALQESAAKNSMSLEKYERQKQINAQYKSSGKSGGSKSGGKKGGNSDGNKYNHDYGDEF